MNRTDLSRYTAAELRQVLEMIDIVGGSLADTFTLNADTRPLACLAGAMDQILGNMDRLVIEELFKREGQQGCVHDEANDKIVTPFSGAPDYIFSYGTLKASQ